MNSTPIYELPRLPRRAQSGHKGTYGKVLVVAGSRGMSGAAVLCGRAAARSSAGLVASRNSGRRATDCRGGVSRATPRSPIHQRADGTFGDGTATELVNTPAAPICWHSDQDSARGRAQAAVRATWRPRRRRRNLPVVLDADGLFALSPFVDEFRRSGPFVLTPHPGEFSARLSGLEVPHSEEQRREQAVEFAAKVRLRSAAERIRDACHRRREDCTATQPATPEWPAAEAGTC